MPPILVIMLCLLAGLAALVGIGVQAIRHGARRVWTWLLLPLGGLLVFAFIPASIGFAEGVWGVRSPVLWLLLSVGTIGVACQVFGWRAVLRPRLGPTQCTECGYDTAGLDGCPECGRRAGA